MTTETADGVGSAGDLNDGDGAGRPGPSDLDSGVLSERVPVRVRVLGTPVDVVEPATLGHLVGHRPPNDTPGGIALVRTWDVVVGLLSKRRRDELEQMRLVLPVSKSIVSIARFLGLREPIRYAPFDLLVRALTGVEAMGRGVFIVGGSRRELTDAEANIRRTFPGLRVVGRHTARYAPAEEDAILTAERKSDAALLIVSLPGGKARRWFLTKRDRLAGGFVALCPEGVAQAAGTLPKPSRESFLSGRFALGEFIRRPWRLLRLPCYVLFGPIVLVAGIVFGFRRRRDRRPVAAR